MILKKRKMIITILVVLVAFGFFNLFWLLTTIHTYKPFIEAVPKDEQGLYVKFDESKKITYNVKLPDYLHFTGNLGISGKNGVLIIIWPPSIFENGYEYGVRVQDDTGAYEIYVDEHLNPVSGEQIQKDVIDRNYENIKNLYDSAMEMWF